MSHPERLAQGFLRRYQVLSQELAHLEGEAERLRQALEKAVPMPVSWRRIRCGKEACKRCPHGPYPYLRVKEGGKWTWKYLGRGWQPPEGFQRASHFRETLSRYRKLLARIEEVKELLEEMEEVAGDGAG